MGRLGAKLTFAASLLYTSVIAASIPSLSTRTVQNNVVSVVCVAGECFEGYSNITLGAQLKSNGNPLLTLLPGQYDANSNPQLLHNALTTSGAALTLSTGVNATSISPISFPLTIQVQPGAIGYSQTLYAGDSSAFSLSGNSSTTNSSQQALAANGSLALSGNTWAAVLSPSNTRLIVWDSVPDFSQLPSGNGGYSLLEVQSGACTTPCASPSYCSALNATCVCPPGFTGSACETCASGFFGPNCLPCPSNCTTCDDGPSGSGICLTPQLTNAPSTCNCINGDCDGNGGCTCAAGWGTATNGTLCAGCAPGFFLNQNGTCAACNLGCEQCVAGTGQCLQCSAGFGADPNSSLNCVATIPLNSAGQQCPDGSFPSGNLCQSCSPLCKTCIGGGSNQCIECAQGSFRLNSTGACVSADSNGICAGSNGGLIGNNVKGVCDTCPQGCATCEIPGFQAFSLITQAQCTTCIPGLFLNNGQCVQSCPSGTFLGSDGKSCQACDSSCGTCAGTSTFCLSCKNNQLASQGKCVTACPSSTVQSSINGTCVACHQDCATCSGPSFTQCSTCPSGRPVLSSGRCLPTCSKGQFFDSTTGGCQACDSSCASCDGPGSSNCLSCGGSVLKAGQCTTASCKNGASVIAGLGVCLDSLVFVPSPTSPSASPLPTITGLTDPVVPTSSHKLVWWEILLMVLGCAFIFTAIFGWWRRRAVQKRKSKTREFMMRNHLDTDSGGWRERLRRLFGGKRVKLERNDSDRGSIRSLASDLERLRVIELQRHEAAMNKLGGSPSHSRQASVRDYYDASSRRSDVRPSSWNEFEQGRGNSSKRGSVSIYSKATGQPAPSSYSRGQEGLPSRSRTPEPRTMVRNAPAHTDPNGGDIDTLLNHRFSTATRSTMKTAELISLFKEQRIPRKAPPAESEAQSYMMEVSSLQRDSREGPSGGSYWLTPVPTGESTQSKNPFLRP